MRDRGPRCLPPAGKRKRHHSPCRQETGGPGTPEQRAEGRGSDTRHLQQSVKNAFKLRSLFRSHKAIRRSPVMSLILVLAETKPPPAPIGARCSETSAKSLRRRKPSPAFIPMPCFFFYYDLCNAVFVYEGLRSFNTALVSRQRHAQHGGSASYALSSMEKVLAVRAPRS